MCFSIPVKITLRKFNKILEECFGLKNDEKKEEKVNTKTIIYQPVKQEIDLEMGNINEKKYDSDEELANSYDII
jgi:hypothetical protein